MSLICAMAMSADFLYFNSKIKILLSVLSTRSILPSEVVCSTFTSSPSMVKMVNITA
ncbi:Uncharacterised protein [Segatella copri]|nr:Uncharacterised protein [Segatella copri]